MVLAGLTSLFATGQTSELPTRGREFWLGYMQNAYGAQTLSVRIASPVATSGTVSMPGTGWSASFSVTANSATTVVVPAAAEHTGSEFVANKGVLVQAADTVTVTAVSFQNFTADGTRVLPRQALANDYIVDAYQGLPGFGDFYKSELLIVATADNTNVTITPSVNTSGGHAAGVPFTITLNTGETYQVQSALASLDLTGTIITGAATNGPCRAFAVFGGSMCANVPVACQACDHLFEQMLPIGSWGTQFFTVPIQGAGTWSYRILAAQNGTSVSINGGAAIALNAGQKYEVNGSSTPACITSNLPVNVVEMTEGFNCASSGDPSMIVLAPAARLTRKATFSTVNSAQITTHAVAITVPSASIGTVLLDGSPIAAGAYQNYTSCSGFAFASLSVGAGTHTLQGANGFIAYAVGHGTGESYFFGLENNAPPVIDPDTLICTSTQITLQSPVPIVNAQWYEESAPGTILATGSSYTFTPTQNGIYVVNGEMPVNQCPLEFTWGIGLPVNPAMTLTANGTSPANVCQFSPVQLNATPAPDPLWYDLQWAPAALLSDPNIPDPLAYPTQDTWFHLDVTSPIGCGSFSDSVFVSVDPNTIVAVEALVNDTMICSGQQVSLNTRVESAIGNDAFDGGIGTLWASVQGGTTNTSCGSVSGSALQFNGPAVRSAQTLPMNVVGGGNLRFSLKIANGTAPCDNADPGEDIWLEYSTNAGVNWNTITIYNEAGYPSFTSLIVPIPAAALTGTTLFRWRQPVHSGSGQDNWALDNVIITRYGATGVNYSWTPAPLVSNSTIADPTATPTFTTWFEVQVTDPNSGCAFTDSVQVQVQPTFNVTAGNDTVICNAGPVQLQAVPNYGSGHSFSWTPLNGSLNSTSIANPVATPAATTTYVVTVTSPIGCTATDATTITVGQLTSVNLSAADAHLCPGESTSLNAAIVASGAYTIAWTPNNGSLSSTNIVNPVATPTTTTTYTCTVTDNASGCQVSAQVTINVHGPYTITLPPNDTLCTVLGSQLTMTHNAPAPVNIAWAPAAFLNSASIASPTILVDTSATYTATVTDQWGCSSSDSVTVVVAFDDLVTPVSVGACQGQSLVLDAGYPGSTYAWNTGATTQTITVSTDSTYVVEITDPSLCQAMATFNATFHPLPLVDLGPDTALCGASSFVLDAGNPGSTYLWSPGGQTTQTITVSANNTYGVTVSSAQGCSAGDVVTLTFNALPTDVLNDVTACVSQPVTLDAGNPGCSYAWSTGATTQTISAPATNTYSVSITTSQACTATYDAVVTLLPDPSVDLGPDTVLCSGDPLILDAGNPGLTYLWSTLATTQSIAPFTSGSYWVAASNGYCADNDTVDVIFLPLPTDVLNDITSCVTDPVILDAGNTGCTYLWSPGGETTQTITCPSTGPYSVTITAPAGCSATYSAVVTYAVPPIVNLGPDTTLCEGEVLTLDAGNPGSTYLWSTGATAHTINVTGSGLYSCTVDNGYCTASDQMQADFNPMPDPLSMHEHFTCLDEDPHYVVIDAGNDGSSFNWSTGDTAQVILAGAYGWYIVEVTTPNNCAGKDSAQVIEFCPASIYIPNTFTPNGDGINDTWGPAGKSIASFELTVFDRYGHALFSTTDLASGWDGTVGGELVKSEVYVWRMVYRFLLDEEGHIGEQHEQLGHVTVLY